MSAVGAQITTGFDALTWRKHGRRTIRPHLGVFVGLLEDGTPEFVFR